jgi:hypothetical protein
VAEAEWYFSPNQKPATVLLKQFAKAEARSCRPEWREKDSP